MTPATFDQQLDTFPTDKDGWLCPECGSRDFSSWGDTEHRTESDITDHVECRECGFTLDRPDDEYAPETDGGDEPEPSVDALLQRSASPTERIATVSLGLGEGADEEALVLRALIAPDRWYGYGPAPRILAADMARVGEWVNEFIGCEYEHDGDLGPFTITDESGESITLTADAEGMVDLGDLGYAFDVEEG